MLAINQYKLNQNVQRLFEVVNTVFCFAYNLEMIFRMIALESQYYSDNWNIFDMFIVIAADFGMIQQFFNLSGNFKTAATTVRAFRILRFVRVFRKIKSVKIIINALILILPNIVNVMSLYVLVLFIYAMVGMNLFGKIKERDLINEKFNF
jgi:hypothetical protein